MGIIKKINIKKLKTIIIGILIAVAGWEAYGMVREFFSSLTDPYISNIYIQGLVIIILIILIISVLMKENPSKAFWQVFTK